MSLGTILHLVLIDVLGIDLRAGYLERTANGTATAEIWVGAIMLLPPTGTPVDWSE